MPRSLQRPFADRGMRIRGESHEECAAAARPGALEKQVEMSVARNLQIGPCEIVWLLSITSIRSVEPESKANGANKD